MVYNPYASNTNYLYSFNTGSTTFGNIIDIRPQYPINCNINDGDYNYIDIQFED